MKRLARGKRSSLFWKVVTYGCKSFFTLVSGPNVLKLFTVVIYEWQMWQKASGYSEFFFLLKIKKFLWTFLQVQRGPRLLLRSDVVPVPVRDRGRLPSRRQSRQNRLRRHQVPILKNFFLSHCRYGKISKRVCQWIFASKAEPTQVKNLSAAPL